jgi:tripartite-type tricarboxylate transporter receptor subunit TctC
MRPSTIRHGLLAFLAGLSPLASPLAAQAQTYPAKPITLVIGFPQGGPNDILGRIVAGWLSKHLGQPVVAENRAGSSGNIATEAVVKATPDGYTLLLVGPANAISGSNPNLPFVFLRDIAPVGGITREALVLVVHPSVAAKSPAELIALAKGGQAKLRMASTGVGSSPHLSGELFKSMTGITLPVVHYQGGGPALKAMIAGEAEVMFEPMSASIEPVRTGKLRALAVSTATRSSALPELPVLSATVPGYEASAVTGLGAPRGTPAAVIATLNAALNAAFSDAATKAKLADTGGEPLPGTPEDFGRLMQAETEKWGKVLRAAGLAPVSK